MTRSYATGYDLAAAIRPESYHISRDAAGRAYAFRMDDEARRHLARCVRASAPEHQAIEAFDVAPNHLRLRVDPTAEGRPDSLGDWDAVLLRAADTYNDRHATDGLDEIHVGERFIGHYRLEGAPTAAEFIEDHTGRAPDEHEAVLEYVNPEEPPSQGEGSRWLTWRVVVLIDPDTYDEPEPSDWDVPAEDRPGFAWDVDALERSIEDRIDWPTGQRGLQRVEVTDKYVLGDIYEGGLGAPQGFARQVRRSMLGYNRQRDATVDVPGGTVKRPELEILKRPHYVGPIDTGAVDEWVRGLPDLDGEPVDPTPEPEPEPATDPSGGLAGLNPFGGD